MFTRILVPLDGSGEAERMCEWVIGLAKSSGAEIELLAVVDPARLTFPGRSHRHPVTGAGPLGVGRQDEAEAGQPLSPRTSVSADTSSAMIAGWVEKRVRRGSELSSSTGLWRRRGDTFTGAR